MEEPVRMWWERLDVKEQEILLKLLYGIRLSDYVDMDKDGNITGIKGDNNG
jgi:hypothetical protein